MKASVFNFGMKYGDSPRRPVRFLAGCCRKWEQWKADRIEREFRKEKASGMSGQDSEVILKNILEYKKGGAWGSSFF